MTLVTGLEPRGDIGMDELADYVSFLKDDRNSMAKQSMVCGDSQNPVSSFGETIALKYRFTYDTICNIQLVFEQGSLIDWAGDGIVSRYVSTTGFTYAQGYLYDLLSDLWLVDTAEAHARLFGYDSSCSDLP